MKLKPRKFFDSETVQHALGEYQQAWEMLLGDDRQSFALLASHERELKAEIRARKAHHTLLSKQYRSSDDEAHKHVLETALFHANRDISVLERATRDLGLIDTIILQNLQEEAQKVVTLLKAGEEAIFQPNGKPRSEYVKALYARSREETWERFAVLDAFCEAGEEHAIEQRERNERSYQLALIPRHIRRAKWKFMLALADAAYSIDIGNTGDESINPNHLTLISHLYTRLSDHERGADNDHMPFTHKYRHNPAIHSIHTLALADKFFHQVLWMIDHQPERFLEGKEKAAAKLQQMRSRIFLTALVHDMGEIDGELSQGISVAHTDPTLKDRIEQARNDMERATFIKHLERRREHLFHTQKGGITTKPITDGEWTALRQQYLDAFDLSEQTDVFLGRFFKTLERMQSQQDYLRFQNKSGAKPLIESDDANKRFSMSYVPKIFYDAAWDAPAPGPKALAKLAEKGRDSLEVKLQRYLTEETEKEITHLTSRNIESYYGADSPQALKYQRNARAAQAR